MDIALEFNGEQFDIAIENGDLKKDAGLETAVIISLFTDQRVTAKELAELYTDRGGWWGDAIAEIQGDNIGSKLWLTLQSGKLTNEALDRIENFGRDSLLWMIEDNLCSTVSVSATLINKNIYIKIELPKKNENDILYSFLWDGQKIKRG